MTDEDNDCSWAYQAELELRQIDDDCLYEQLPFSYEVTNDGDHSF